MPILFLSFCNAESLISLAPFACSIITARTIRNYIYDGNVFNNIMGSHIEILFTSGAYGFIEGDKDKSLPGIGEISVDSRRV